MKFTKVEMEKLNWMIEKLGEKGIKSKIVKDGPPQDDKERYEVYLSACSMQNKISKYFDIHTLCKERVCKK